MAHLTAVSNQIKTRVLAADSTAMSTQLLVDALARDTQCQMIQSSSGVLETVKSEKPQVAVISAQLENSGSFELVREIRMQTPATRVVVLLDSSEQTQVIEAFRAGAHGVFCRTEPFRLLAKCIQCVANGQIWANSRELHYVLEALAQPKPSASVNLKAGLLSAREIDVVMCVAEGLSNREIAQRLKLTEHTIKNYLFRIFDKLGVSSRVEVVLYALRNGNGPQPVSAPVRKGLRPVTRVQKAVGETPVTIR
jgi:two-component system, NarL family, nitrate/nitrite response regulator NarL